MIDVNKFENRIVKFKRISEGVETTKEAELRRIDYDKSSAEVGVLPSSDIQLNLTILSSNLFTSNIMVIFLEKFL